LGFAFGVIGKDGFLHSVTTGLQVLLEEIAPTLTAQNFFFRKVGFVGALLSGIAQQAALSGW
jgi:hypothetical protein